MSVETIVKHYEDCFDKHGDNHKGVDWPDSQDALKRYDIMFDILPKDEVCTLLDFGCGLGHFYDYLKSYPISKESGLIEYYGVDFSNKFINACHEKYGDFSFKQMDVLQNDCLDDYDYIIANGVFTEKRELSYNDMFSYFKETIKVLYKHTKRGLAFNVMSKHVDWERDDLFHVSFDEMASFLTKEVNAKFVFNNHYGLYEYTVYVYR